MMYNDVDDELPPFTDTIDGEEIFLFSNAKTSSTGASFLHEDDDEHLRHQHNVVASTSSHLPVDVDELILNSNFLDQQNCDQSEDPLFWNCKDITDDHTQHQSQQQQTQQHPQVTTQHQHTTQLQQQALLQTSFPTQPILQQDQYQTKWVTFVHSNDQYQTFTTTQPQYFDKISQPLIQTDVNPNIQTSVAALISATDQTQLQPQQQQQQQQHQQQQSHQQQLQQQHLIQIAQPRTQHIQQTAPTISTTSTSNTTSSLNSAYQQPQSEQKPTDINPTLNSSVAAIISTSNQTHLQPQQQQQPQHFIQIAQPRTQLIQQATPTITATFMGSPYQQSQSEQKPKITTAFENVSIKKETLVKQKPKEKQTRLDCPYCKRSFSKNFDLQQHMRCHTGEKPFQCIVCGRGFAQKSNVKKHMQAHKVWPEGPNNPPIPTNQGSARSRNNSASSSFGTPREDECMQENESLQINDGNVNNNGITLGLSNDRKNDGNDLFTENRYSCSYCPFNGRTYFELKSHLTIHKREKVFKCIVSSCGKTFSGGDLQGFLDHVTGHKDLIYHCHLCSGQFYSLDEFGEHQKHHSSTNQIKRTSQQQSQSQTSTQQAPVIVLNQQNNTSLRQQNQQVTTNQLQAQHNQRQYNQQTHQQNNQKSAQLYNSQPPKNNQKYFRCSKCMNRYTTQTALDHHLSISTHNFPCTECNKVFMCERYLRRHLNTHTTVQHVCTYCDKQFKTAAYLKMHSVVHTGEKPFRCNLCEAAFNRRDKLNRHKLTHETVKKYKCPFKPHIGCTKEFNRPDKLKAHVLTHSGVRPHPCDACSRTFSRLSRLKEHKKLHHDANNNSNLDIKQVDSVEPKIDENPPPLVKTTEITSTGTSCNVQDPIS